MSALRPFHALRTTLRQVPKARSFHSTVRRNEHFLDANTTVFEKAVSNKDKVVLVDFYANWCNPCKMLSPVLEKLTTDESIKSGSGKALDLVTVDTDVEGELAGKYGVTALPTVIAFKDGQPISQFKGAMPEHLVRKFIE
ncbi:thioredoxin-like protein [Abortiporus biennis]|nr:thioredoxin-like protein [Abortiporus biennis]